VKLHYFVTILPLVTLQGSVYYSTGEVDSFNTHCSALIAAATVHAKFDGNL